MTFDERIEKAIAETKNECHYNPKAFIQMVETYGAKANLVESREAPPTLSWGWMGLLKGV